MDAVQITELLKKNFHVVEFQLEDDSVKHKRHKESQGKGGHYNLLIVSDDFEGMNLVSRHRKIYEVLQMKAIHALSISAWTVREWEQKQREK